MNRSRRVGRPSGRRRFWPRLAAAGCGLCTFVLGVVGLGGGLGSPVAADTSCSSAYAVFESLASAAGMQVSQTTPGFAVPGGDGALTQSQSLLGSLAGSTSFAGIPFSQTAAGNAGLAKIDANQVPMFAISSYPADPDVEKQTAVATISAKTSPDSATASTVGGGPASTAGTTSTSATSSCAADGTLSAVADNKVDGVVIAGVLKLGSVTSHASVSVSAAGDQSLEGTMEISGASVLGQPISITDQGLVIAGATIPLPSNPLVKALTDAGVEVRYIAAEKDPTSGQVFAPALEIVYKNGPDLGQGPGVTTMTFGRALARVSSRVAPQIQPASSPTTTNSPAPPRSSGGVGSPVAKITPTPLAEGSRNLGSPRPASTNDSSLALIASASIRNIYPALAGGAVVFFITWFVFEHWGVRRRWS